VILMVMKVPGIDPVLLQRVEERTKKQMVHESQNTRIEDKKEQRSHREKQKRNYGEIDVAEVIQKLNKMLAAMGKDIYFELNDEGSKKTINLVDSFTKRLIKEVPLEEIIKIEISLQELLGLMVNELV